MEHKSQPPLLRVNDDVLHEICKAVLFIQPRWPGDAIRDMKSLVSLASTSKHLRHAAAPLLFRKIAMVLDDDLSCQKALLAAQMVEKGTLIHEYTRECSILTRGGEASIPLLPPPPRTRLQKFLTVITRGQFGGVDMPTPPQQPVSPLSQVPQSIVRGLIKMKRMTKLALVVPQVYAQSFRDAFEGLNVRLPLLKTLALGPHLDWLVPLCSNVDTIASECSAHWDQAAEDGREEAMLSLIHAASKAEGLRRFEMRESCEYWTLETILQTMPHVAELFLSNRHDPFLDIIGCETHPMRADARLLSTIGKFSRLRYPEIPGIAETPMWPWCGNAFDGPGGELLRERLERETEEALRRAAEAIAPACPVLERLSLGGDSRWVVERSASGDYVGVRTETDV